MDKQNEDIIYELCELLSFHAGTEEEMTDEKYDEMIQEIEDGKGWLKCQFKLGHFFICLENEECLIMHIHWSEFPNRYETHEFDRNIPFMQSRCIEWFRLLAPINNIMPVHYA